MDKLTCVSLGSTSATIETFGSQLASLKVRDVEYLWQRDAKWWPKSAPILFPMVGSLRGDAAICAGGTCHMGRHGLARDYQHEIVEQSESSVTLRLESSEDTRAKYPYDFRLDLTFALEGTGEAGSTTLVNTFTVTNTGEVPMPFCLGGHPAFNVPLAEGETFEDYKLEFSEPWSASTPVIAEGGLLSYEALVTLFEDASELALTHKLFEQDAVVLEGVPGDTLTMVGPAGKGVRVDFAGFDHIGIWSAAAAADGSEAPFVALEPWCGTATRTDEDNVFEHKQNVITAAPGETVVRSFSVTVL